MGFQDAPVLFKTNFILIIIAVIMQILGLSLPYWYQLETEISSGYGISGTNINSNMGLWQSCINGKCSQIPFLTDWLNACRAFSILGLLVLVAALVLVVICLFVKDEPRLKLIIWILAFVAAFCLMIEFSVYAGETGTTISSFANSYVSQSASYSGAFALTIIDFILCLVIGGIGLMDWLGKGKELCKQWV